jgi:catechol-2,3-dioxygenase
MDTLPLDIDGVLSELGQSSGPGTGLHPETVLGHMHLHVRDIPEARVFYCDVLGFDLMFNMGSALFVSAGGYHHHIGMNVWGTQGPPATRIDRAALLHHQMPSSRGGAVSARPVGRARLEGIRRGAWCTIHPRTGWSLQPVATAELWESLLQEQAILSKSS